MNAWQRLWDSDVPFSMRLRGLRNTLRCYVSHDAHWVPSYHITPSAVSVVGYRFRCRRCNRDLYWGTPPDDSLVKERSR